MALEFRRRGHLVFERNYEDHYPTRWRTPALKAVRRLLRPVMARDYNLAVRELLAVSNLDFLLVFKGMLLAPATLDLFRQRGTRCYCFYPDVSFDDHGPNILACLPLYHTVFTSKSYHLEDDRLKRLQKEWVYAPHGFDPEVHRPVTTQRDKLQDVYACDVSFVGNWSARKEVVLAGLIMAIPALDLKIWGPGWDASRADVRRYWQGRGAYGDELAAIYSLSRINLGLLSEAGTSSVSGDRTTARTWQIPGAGGFMLHEDTPDVRAAFEPDSEIALFASADALVNQVRQYLESDVKRKGVATAGHRKALAIPYTYGQAVETIIEHHATDRR